jgi:hypothetical protein
VVEGMLSEVILRLWSLPFSLSLSGHEVSGFALSYIPTRRYCHNPKAMKPAAHGRKPLKL